MDLLTFIVEITKAATWPVAAVCIALLFRRQLQGLLGRIRKGKLGPAEFEFEEAVRELQEETASLPAPASSTNVGTPTISLASSDPRSAVISSWVEVEVALDRLARKSPDFNALGLRTSSQHVRALQKSGVLEPRYAAMFSELRFLRNRAAHDIDFQPSADSVLSFARLAKDLAAELSRLADER